MDKIASDATLTPENLHKIAAFGFATVLGSPATGMAPAEVKEKASKFHQHLKAAQARHNNLVALLRGQLPALLSPAAA